MNFAIIPSSITLIVSPSNLGLNTVKAVLIIAIKITAISLPEFGFKYFKSLLAEPLKFFAFSPPITTP